MNNLNLDEKDFNWKVSYPTKRDLLKACIPILRQVMEYAEIEYNEDDISCKQFLVYLDELVKEKK